MDIKNISTREDKLKFFEAAVKAEATAKFEWDAAKQALDKFNKKAKDLEQDATDAHRAWSDAETVKSQLFEELRTVQNL